MKQQNIKLFLSLFLLTSLFWQAIPIGAQQIEQQAKNIQEENTQNRNQIFANLLQQGRGTEFLILLERVFNIDAGAAEESFNENSDQLFQSVSNAGNEKAEKSLDEQIAERRQKGKTNSVVSPSAKTDSAPKTKLKTKTPAKPKKFAFDNRTKINWPQFTFGFQPFAQDNKPEIKFTETDKEIKATGENKKSFETKDAKGTRTQKAETRYTKDGKTFGVEIKNTEIIEAVAKADGKSFRKEISMIWGAEVAACPDVNGVTAGTGKAKVQSKTIYTENGETVTMTTDFDLQAKVTGYVNDQAEMTHYDLQVDAYTTNDGYEDALRRNLIKEIKIKDGRYGLQYDISGNTIEVSDGKYGGYRKPAKMGKAEARKLTTMSDADTTVVGSAIGPMIPAIWNSANEMYSTAQKNWKNYGCVEVVCKVPKQTLKPGEEVKISAETVHLQDNSKIKAHLTAEAYQATVTPESQSGTPAATFTLTQEGEETSSFYVESVSKRGIGKGDVEFQLEKEKEEPAEPGVWTGTIKAERKQREEREKRSGANLAENGGYLETITNVQLKLTGRLDRTVDATNAHIALVGGEQEQIDYEYDKYKVDEGYCGPNAVPYKGPKEITRTSTTIINFNKETRVYIEIGNTSGSITFSLPEQTGRTIHSYVHNSPCSVHDRANTNEAIDEEVASVGGSFAFSFPIEQSGKTIKGSISVREEDGGTTTYTWELRRN